MNEQYLHDRLRDYVEAEIGSDFHLWAKIQPQLGPVQGLGMSEAGLPRKGRHWRTAFMVGVLFVGGLAALTAAVPAAQAGVGMIMQRFGFVLIQPSASAPLISASPSVQSRTTPVAQGGLIPIVSLAEAQQRVTFHIPQPTWLPAGLTFGGAHVFPPNWAQVFYRPVNGSPGGLGVEITQGKPSGGYVYPPEAVQPVSVNGVSALYAHGTGDPPAKWDAQADAGMLSWEADGFTYVVRASELHLSREELIRVAESLH